MTTPMQVIPIATGLESDVYKIIMGKNKLILKAKNHDGNQQYKFEAFAYAEAATQGAHVPHVMYVDDACLLMTILPGEEMDDRTELFENQTLFESIATDLARCHDIKLPGFGAVSNDNNSFAGVNSSWQDYLINIGQTLNTLKPIGTLSAKDIKLLKTFWNSELPRMTLHEGSLVHGDFAMSAVFVNDTTYSGIIDFGDALIGDPLMDLAYFRFKEITKPYGQSTYDLLVNAYCKVTDNLVDENRIAFYLVYWGLQRLSHCPYEKIRKKFGDKLHIVSELILNDIRFTA